MAVNKVVMNTENGAETLIDLTADSVTPETLAAGVTAHDASGEAITGTMPTTNVLYTAQTLTEEQKAQARANIDAASANKVSQLSETLADKVNKTGITLGKNADGQIFIYVDGVAVGNGVEINGEIVEGDVIGYVDENNNIVIQGGLALGTYSVKYEMEDGSTVDIGNLVLGENIHCSITKNLTNCTINNNATQVDAGDSYSATITVNSGYVLTTVKVTMGGIDVTSTVYSDGVITISSVTGNVVITANAVKEAAKTYTITSNLSNCANSNSVTVVEEGTAYNATITANDGYKLDSVNVTMGGSAVSVTNGVINIASVTGNIVITAVASVKNWISHSENADGTPFVGTNGEDGYKANTRLGTSDGGERSGATGIELTGFIPVTASDTLYFKGVTVTTSTNETTCFYDSNHTHLGGGYTNSFFGTMDGSVKAVKISDIKKEPILSKASQIAYVRIAASEINANSVITKNQPIE